ncbi:MAG TPA: ABC transporter ATP-binding protein [Kofleriaceae bacterium]|nr:ABC transporter ATP-binding protein [Kofleriaceae bacterium]
MTSERDDIAVRLDGVAKRFGEITALDAITLLVRRGELMTLLGPSGCGKTTLLNLVAGFLMPDSGEISIDGQRITDLPTSRREIGIMFQSYALFPHMSVAANVGYGLRMRRTPKPEIADRVAAALALVKLEGLEDRRPRQLSGGQQQRVALARALITRPTILFADEPTGNLDSKTSGEILDLLRTSVDTYGQTTVMVTHEARAAVIADRILFLADGLIVQERRGATTAEVLEVMSTLSS